MASIRVCLLTRTGCRGSSNDGACQAWMWGVCSRWSFPGSCLWSSGQFLHKQFAFTNFATHCVQKDTVYHWKQIGSGIFIYLCVQGKVFPVHALKMWGSGGIAACVLNLSSNWRWLVPMSMRGAFVWVEIFVPHASFFGSDWDAGGEFIMLMHHSLHCLI
jgi:hypothetical protein